MTFGVDEELAPTPLDFVGQASFCAVERTVFSQVGEQRVGVWPINLAFFEERKLDVEGIAELLDFIIISWLLVAKLIGRKGKNHESFVFELIVQLDQISI